LHRSVLFGLSVLIGHIGPIDSTPPACEGIDQGCAFRSRCGSRQHWRGLAPTRAFVAALLLAFLILLRRIFRRKWDILGHRQVLSALRSQPWTDCPGCVDPAHGRYCHCTTSGAIPVVPEWHFLALRRSLSSGYAPISEVRSVGCAITGGFHAHLRVSVRAKLRLQ
jgi:hypothetical protein